MGFFQEFCNSSSIVEFEELRQFAVVRQKLIVRPDELLFPTFDIKTQNSPRPGFDKQLDAIAYKLRQKEDKLLRDKAVRVQLDRKKIIISAIKFPVCKCTFLQGTSFLDIFFKTYCLLTSYPK